MSATPDRTKLARLGVGSELAARTSGRTQEAEPGYPVTPPTVTLSSAAFIAFGPMLGIVKKLAEPLDFGRLGRPDYGRHHTEPRVATV